MTKKIKLNLCARLAAIFYRTDHKKMSSLIFKQLELSKRYSANYTTPLCILILSVYITHMLKLRKPGIELAKIAYGLEKTFDKSPYKCQFLQIYYTFVQCWFQPIDSLLPSLKKAIQEGLISGDRLYTEMGSNNLVSVVFLKGTSRDTHEKEIKKVSGIYEDTSSLREIPILITEATMISLSQNKIISTEKYEKQIQAAKDYNLLASIYTKKALIYYHNKNCDSKIWARQALERVKFQKGFFYQSKITFGTHLFSTAHFTKKRGLIKKHYPYL